MPIDWTSLSDRSVPSYLADRHVHPTRLTPVGSRAVPLLELIESGLVRRDVVIQRALQPAENLAGSNFAPNAGATRTIHAQKNPVFRAADKPETLGYLLEVTPTGLEPVLPP